MLSEMEQVGIKMVVLMRYSKTPLPFKCEGCVSQDKYNCAGVEEHSAPVFYHKDFGTFYYCPMLTITPQIANFIDEYDYYEKYPSSAPKYQDVNFRYWDACKVYESYKNIMLNDDTPPKPDSATNMSKMQSLIKARK